MTPERFDELMRLSAQEVARCYEGMRFRDTSSGDDGLTADEPKRLSQVHAGEDGEAVEYSLHVVPDEEQQPFFETLKVRLFARARERLAPGTVIEIRGAAPHFYGRLRGMAWYTSADMPCMERWKADGGGLGWISWGGYDLIAREEA